jgi:hypothetical protein
MAASGAGRMIEGGGTVTLNTSNSILHGTFLIFHFHMRLHNSVLDRDMHVSNFFLANRGPPSASSLSVVAELTPCRPVQRRL